MLLLSSDALTVDGVTVFPDHADPNQFWYLPAPVDLAKMPDSDEPQFLLIEYTPDVVSSGVQGGGFLNLTTWLRVPTDTLQKITGQISTAFPTATDPHLAPAPFDEGTVQVVTLNAQGGGNTIVKAADGSLPMVQNILGAVSPELYGDEDALFGLTLTEEAVTILKDAFQDGMAPTGVIYNLKFTGVRPALDVKVTADLKRVYDSFGLALGVSAYWASVGIDATFEKLRQDGTIQIQVINLAGDKDNSDKEQQALDLFKQDILTKWFEPSLSPATAALADAEGASGASGVAGDAAKLAAAGQAIAKSAAQAASPFGVSLKLKIVHQDEQKTVTYEYNRMDAVQRTYGPQGYFGLLLGSVDLSKHFLQVDGTDDFFRKFSVVLTPPHDFAGVGLQTVHVALDYGDPTAAGAKHGEFVFDQTNMAQTTWALFEGEVHTTDFNYTATYSFDPESGWDGASNVYALPTVTTDNRQLTLDPHDTLGFLAVNVMPGRIDPNVVDRVEVTLNYADTSGWTTSGFFIVRSGAAPQAWKLRLSDKTQRSYTYTTHCVLKDGTAFDAGPFDSTASAVFANDAFGGGIDVILQPAFDPGKTKSVIIELNYADATNNYHFSKTQFLQASSGSNAITVHIPIIDPAQANFTYKLTIISQANQQLHGDAVTTTEPLVVIGDTP